MIKRLFSILIFLGAAAMAVNAQDDNSGAVMRRNGGPTRGQQEEGSTPGVSQRMQSFYQTTEPSDADLQWMRVIYRHLDLQKPENSPLYFPEEPIDDMENLFRIIMRLLADGQLNAYEYLDGREIFTDQYKSPVRDILDRFGIYYTEAKGSSEKNPKFEINEADVPTNEVLSYYIIERWEFDTRSNRMRTRVEAICPVLHRSGDFGGEAVRYPMFWIKFNDLRPHLAQQYIFTSDDNNLATCTYDDYFNMNMYDGEIYKTRNLQNKSMAQLYPDEQQLKQAQDSIQHRLDTFGEKLWVPNREDIIAAREAREQAEAIAAAGGDSTLIAQAKDTKKSSRRSSAASRNKQKADKQKKPKSVSKDTSSNAARSVRRKK